MSEATDSFLRYRCLLFTAYLIFVVYGGRGGIIPETNIRDRR